MGLQDDAEVSNSGDPFALAFGTEAVAPVEVGIKSPRVELASEEQNDEGPASELGTPR